MKRLLARVFIVTCGAVPALGSGACGARSAIQRERGAGGTGGVTLLDDGGTGGSVPLDDGGDASDAIPCVPDGEECLQPTDCCSNECNAQGTCGPVQCRKEFYFCFSDDDCCNSSCVHLGTVTFCYVCLANDLPCSDAGIGCCSGYCDPEGRCVDHP